MCVCIFRAIEKVKGSKIQKKARNNEKQRERERGGGTEREKKKHERIGAHALEVSTFLQVATSR